MNPIAFQAGPVTVTWYGIMIGLGILAAFLVVHAGARLRGLDPEPWLDGAIYMLPVAFLGARLYYVIFQWEFYRNNLSEIPAVWHGGLAIHGGLLAGIAFFFWYSGRKKLSPLLYLDLVAPGVVLAQSIGRWGNFFNQEAHGGPVEPSFMARFPEFIREGMNINGVYYHPTFLYESLWNLVVFAVLFLVARRWREPEGRILALYLILYSLGRFFIEGLRTDSLMLGPLRAAQLVSLTGIAAGAALLILRRPKKI